MFGINKEKNLIQKDNLSLCFDLSLSEKNFVDYMVSDLYQSILTMCFDKIIFPDAEQDFKDKITPSFYDNLSVEGINKGIIKNLAYGIVQNQKVFLVNASAGDNIIVRQGTQEELQKYEKEQGNIKNQIQMDFTKYNQSKALKLFYSMIYWIIRATNTNVKISNSVLVKIAKLRELVAKEDADEVIKQAKEINDAIKKGNSIIADKDDTMERLEINSQATKDALDVAFSLVSGLIKMPLSFVNGELTTGLTQTGDSDNLAIERGLKNYYYTILKPCTEKLFETKTRFSSDNTAKLKTLIGILPQLELSTLLTDEEKRAIIEDLKVW